MALHLLPLESDDILPELMDAPCIMGIDEAGRGPVLGPMVYGTAICPLDKKEQLAKMGFADSKTLKESQREALFEKIRKCSTYNSASTIPLTPSTPSAQFTPPPSPSSPAISTPSSSSIRAPTTPSSPFATPQSLKRKHSETEQEKEEEEEGGKEEETSSTPVKTSPQGKVSSFFTPKTKKTDSKTDAKTDTPSSSSSSSATPVKAPATPSTPVIGGRASIQVPMSWMVEVLESEDLSKKMLKMNKVNLNTISHDAAINLIRRALAKGLNIKEVYVDTVGPPSKYQAKLQHLFPNIAITVSKKADSLFPIVSAASICAKVVRDYRLRHWEFKEKNLENPSIKFGSGYPGDPNTKAWLKASLDPVFGYPSIMRFSWKTSSNLLQKGAVDIYWNVLDMEDDHISDFQINDKGERYRYFAENSMETVLDFD